jgi:hypothetical protein
MSSPTQPANRSYVNCPNCGRRTSVVFPLLLPGVKPEEAKVVCLACCPTDPVGVEAAIRGGGLTAAPKEDELVATDEEKTGHNWT